MNTLYTRRSARSFLRLAIIACALCYMGFGQAVLASAAGLTAQATPMAPVSALLSPDGGRLDVEESLPVESRDGISCVSFVLPGEAENLDVRVAGQAIARWTSLPQALERGGDLARLRDDLLAEQAKLSGNLESVKARLGLWTTQPEKASLQELEQRDVRMRVVIPVLSGEQMEIERRLALVTQELGSLPVSPALGRMVTVYLAKPATGKLKVSYSYTLRNCWWRPLYSFDAQPDKGEVAVRFEAEVSQLTGMDWRQTRVSLSSHGAGPREPAPLREWIVDSNIKPKAMSNLVSPRVRQAELMQDNAAPVFAPVVADSEGVYAVWTPESNGLPEGMSRLFIAADTWKTPLQWLARPTVGDGRVWLTALHETAPEKAWPTGQADFSVDGRPSGQGTFSLKDGKAELFFGPDPRVSVLTVRDRQRGESGFIAKSRNWTWAWTYRLTNGHNKEIMVRIERPAPQIVDQAVSVKFDDTPEAREDKARHMLYWDVKVAAGGAAEVKHAVTISSPTELPLLPDAP